MSRPRGSSGDYTRLLHEAARDFVEKVERIIQAGIRDAATAYVSTSFQAPAVTTSTNGRSSDRKAPAPSAKTKRSRTMSRTSELKRQAALRVVACPVPECKIPGVRRYSNFCAVHNAALAAADKRRLRDLQKQASTPDAPVA